MDPHWFGSLSIDPDLDTHCGKKLGPKPDPHENQCGSTRTSTLINRGIVLNLCTVPTDLF
jgi:hypothetical protein